MIFQKNIFRGNSFLVTGASSGIGAHAALMLNELGAKIIAIGRNENKLLAQKKHAKNPNNFIVISKDLSDFKNLDKWTLELSKKYGGFNGAVLAAGFSTTIGINFPDYIKIAEKIFALNYFSNLQILKALTDKRIHKNKNSSFVWISSAASIKPNKGLSLYGASKASANTTVKALALEISPQHRINSILLGLIDTPMIYQTMDDDIIQKNLQKSLLGIGKTEYVANLICFLLSDASRWMTGQSIILDGGATLV